MSISAAQKCFGSPLIVESILKHTDHPVQRLDLRLVNKRFNAECLRRIQRSHRKIDLRRNRFVCSTDSPEGPHSYMIVVNDHVIRVPQLRKYFEFLVNVANVKVSELRGTRIWHLNGHDEWQLHQLIHNAVMQVLIRNRKLKVMTGMQEVCKEGCDECERHADGCREYGPLQFEVLTKWISGPKRHFEKLIVWESLFWRIANQCVKESTSTKECLEMMKTLVTPNITCDHLRLQVLENPERTSCSGRYGNFPTTPNQAFPREVIEHMCRVWKVKTIEIEMNHEPREHICSSTWSTKKFFTEFRFDAAHHETRTSTGIRLDNVTIDLSSAQIAARGVFGIKDPKYPNDDCLIFNARRLLPTKHMFVNRHVNLSRRIGRREYYGYSGELSTDHLENIVTAVFMGNPDGKNDERHTTLRLLIELTPMSLPFEFPPVLKLSGKVYTISFPSSAATQDYQWERVQDDEFHSFYSEERLLRTICISEATTNRVLHLELYKEKRLLDMCKESIYYKDSPLLNLFY